MAETYFGVFFLQNIYISGAYFLTIKRFRKAAYKMASFYTISEQLS